MGICFNEKSKNNSIKNSLINDGGDYFSSSIKEKSPNVNST
jgi:hypothetical protein